MTVQLVLLKNTTSENRMRRYFLKSKVNLVQSSLLVLDNRICRGRRCLLGLVTLKKKWCCFLLAQTFAHFAHQTAEMFAEKLCSKDCVYVCLYVYLPQEHIFPGQGDYLWNCLHLAKCKPEHGQTVCGKCRFSPSCLIVW